MFVHGREAGAEFVMRTAPSRDADEIFRYEISSVLNDLSMRQLRDMIDTTPVGSLVATKVKGRSDTSLLLSGLHGINDVHDGVSDSYVQLDIGLELSDLVGGVYPDVELEVYGSIFYIAYYPGGLATLPSYETPVYLGSYQSEMPTTSIAGWSVELIPTGPPVRIG